MQRVRQWRGGGCAILTDLYTVYVKDTSSK